VINEDKDVEALLKHPKPENLVGAAHNLYESLSGVKWLFEVKRVLNAPKRELEKIL
jgi:hypothetical protein